MSKIFYFDENKNFAESLESLFASYQIVLITLNDSKTLQTRAEKDEPDMIIMDGNFAVRESYSNCKALKNERKTKDIPVLFLAAEIEDRDIRAECLNAGADYCILKPVNTRELVNQARSIIKKFQIKKRLAEKTQSGSKIRSKLLVEIEKLNQLNRELEETVYIDKLTGICNRVHFNSKLKEEFHRAHRYETPLSLLLINIDAFGRVNDSFGHDVGDYILMKIANVLQIHSRFSDTVCRLDGAEFAVILPRTDAQGGIFESERLRTAINQSEYIDDSLSDKSEIMRYREKEDVSLTASCGVASFPAPRKVKNEIEFLALARQALSRAKTSGKNKTASANEILNDQKSL
jgi:two-component system cell cycle response regulator